MESSAGPRPPSQATSMTAPTNVGLGTCPMTGWLANATPSAAAGAATARSHRATTFKGAGTTMGHPRSEQAPQRTEVQVQVLRRQLEARRDVPHRLLQP